MSLVTLQIRLRSPKSYNSFWLSQISICASFDEIHLAVHKVEQKDDSKILIELCQFNGNIIKVRLFEQKGAGVMYTNAHSQHIL